MNTVLELSRALTTRLLYTRLYSHNQRKSYTACENPFQPLLLRPLHFHFILFSSSYSSSSVRFLFSSSSYSFFLPLVFLLVFLLFLYLVLFLLLFSSFSSAYPPIPLPPLLPTHPLPSPLPVPSPVPSSVPLPPSIPPPIPLPPLPIPSPLPSSLFLLQPLRRRRILPSFSESSDMLCFRGTASFLARLLKRCSCTALSRLVHMLALASVSYACIDNGST